MPLSEDFIALTKRALRGVDLSKVFVGVLDDKPMDEARIMFLMELGHCVLTGKTIILPVPYGVEVPPKLQAVADRIVRYDPKDMKTLESNLAAVLTEMGVNPQ